MPAPTARQMDLFVNRDEQLLIKDHPSLEKVAKLLPQKPFIKPFDVTEVLPVCDDTVRKWIWSFKFDYIDVGTGDSVARYAINRDSFLRFLATRVNHVRDND